jgi:hypothetical protein
LNTPVLRREDVPGEVGVGPWSPLVLSGGTLREEQLFIGYTEFKPGQGFANFLYSSAPIKVLSFQSV